MSRPGSVHSLGVFRRERVGQTHALVAYRSFVGRSNPHAVRAPTNTVLASIARRACRAEQGGAVLRLQDESKQWRYQMKKLIVLAAVCAFVVGGSYQAAFAADHPQQTRMKD